jgi:hypothetical protein
MKQRPALLEALTLDRPRAVPTGEAVAAAAGTDWMLVADLVARFPNMSLAPASEVRTRLHSADAVLGHRAARDPALRELTGTFNHLESVIGLDLRVLAVVARLHQGRLGELVTHRLGSGAGPAEVARVARSAPELLRPASLTPDVVEDALAILESGTPATVLRALLRACTDLNPVAAGRPWAGSQRDALVWAGHAGLVDPSLAPWAWDRSRVIPAVVDYLVARFEGRTMRWESFAALGPGFSGSVGALADSVEAVSGLDGRRVDDGLELVRLVSGPGSRWSGTDSGRLWAALLGSGPPHPDVVAAAFRWAAPRGDMAVLSLLVESEVPLPAAVRDAVASARSPWLHAKLALRDDIDAWQWSEDRRRSVVESLDMRRHAEGWLQRCRELELAVGTASAPSEAALVWLEAALPVVPGPLGFAASRAMAGLYTAVLDHGTYPASTHALAAAWLARNDFVDAVEQCGLRRRSVAAATTTACPHLASPFAVAHPGLGDELYAASGPTRVQYHLVGSPALSESCFLNTPWGRLVDLLDAPGAMRRLLETAAAPFAGRPEAWARLHRLVDAPAEMADVSVAGVVECCTG